MKDDKGKRRKYGYKRPVSKVKKMALKALKSAYVQPFQQVEEKRPKCIKKSGFSRNSSVKNSGFLWENMIIKLSECLDNVIVYVCL